jgi:hypothetical protein
MAACDSSGKKAWVLLWYQAKGMRSQAVRGAAWERPMGLSTSAAIVAWNVGPTVGERVSHTVYAAVVEEDVCVCVCSCLILRVGLWDCDFVLVAFAGA